MPNLIRGEVPFGAAGREFFICYGTREIAEAQTALGFHRPDPFLPDTVEDTTVLLGDGTAKTQQIVVDAAERQRRMLGAFEACLMNPDPAALLVFFRIGLGPWQRQTRTKLTEEQYQEVVAGLGLIRMKTLHFKAITYGSYLKGDEAEDDSEGKAERAVPASST